MTNLLPPDNWFPRISMKKDEETGNLIVTEHDTPANFSFAVFENAVTDAPSGEEFFSSIQKNMNDLRLLVWREINKP